MSGKNEPARQVYRGVWAVLAGFFKVPQQPPTLLALAGEGVDSFRPSRGFLDYLSLRTPSERRVRRPAEPRPLPRLAKSKTPPRGVQARARSLAQPLNFAQAAPAARSFASRPASLFHGK